MKKILLFFLVAGNGIYGYSQCSVTAPPDQTIACGSLTSLTAPSNQVIYSLTATTCAPIAISGTTAFPVACDDCVTGQIPIGFPFSFYGNVYTDAVISSNGIVGFGAGFAYTGYSPFAIPAGGAPNNYIAGFFADIDIRYGGTITYATVGTAPNRKFVVSYANVVPYNVGTGAGTGTASFQIILNENGSFNVEISQLSANWNASTSGALATSGAENIDGTYAFPVPGRNSTDWPGIAPAAQDCYLFNPAPCTFVRWDVGATTISTNATISVSPTTNTTYTAVWNCNGTTCTDVTVISVTPATLTLGSTINNTSCTTPNGAINFSTNLGNGTYTLNYTLNGTAASSTVTVSGGVLTLSGLSGGTYTGFVIPGTCSPTASGTVTITSPTPPVTTNYTVCQGGAAGTLTATSCGNPGTPTSAGATFNSGALAATDPTWARGTTGTVCNSSAGTTHYYDVFPLTVSVAGSYTFSGCFPAIDGYGFIYQNAFNGANPCGVPANYLAGDDDSAPACTSDPMFTVTLSPGVTYYIVSTSFTATTTGAYSWTFTGPAGAVVNAGATGSTQEWYTAATGGTSISSANPFNPVGVAGSGVANMTTPGVYTYYAACSASSTCRTAATFTITASSVTPTSVSGTGTICNGTTATLGLTGGTLAGGATWEWHTGSCAGPVVGTGTTLTVTPATTTTYYVNATAGGGCPATACASGTLTLPVAGTTLANNNESATCLVNQNGYIHFYHSSGRLLVSINSHGQNLGNVTATAYTGAPLNVNGCLAPAYLLTAMGRHWVINPQFQPASPVDVVLHYDQTEFTALMAAANVNINPYDNVATTADLKLSKYSGPLNVDNLATNNCISTGGNGGTTIHNQAASGAITSMLAGFSATGQFTRFAIPSFSEFWLHGSTNSSPLPVELLSFNASCQPGNTAKISWTTASETNCAKYSVERNAGTAEWSTIAEVDCSQNPQEINSYTITDPDRINGTSYYRLRQTDLNGTERVYDAISVTCESDDLSVIAYPNPATDNVSVEISSKFNLGTTVVEFTDVSGKIIFSKSLDLEKGQTLIPFSTGELSAGPYFIKVKNAQEKFSTIKVIVQK